MVLTRSFQASDIRRFKLRNILDKIGTKILVLYVKCSCGEHTIADIVQSCSQAETLLKLKLDGFPTISLYKGDVLKAIQEVERNPANPTLNLFDITFLNKFLRLAPQGEVNELARLVAIRNDLYHGRYEIDEEVFEQKFGEQEQLFPPALEEVEKIGKAHLASVLLQEKKDEITKALQEIQSFKIDMVNDMKYLKVSEINELLTSAEEYLKIVGLDELEKAYKQLVYVNPVSFLLGKVFNFHLKDFYTLPEFKIRENDATLNFKDVLDIIESRSTCLLIEGPPGIGKTTFSRLLLTKKMSGERFQSLFIIPFECRNESFDSLEDVITDIFPDAARDYSSQRLFRVVMSRNPLFLIDGLDERNEKSKKVVLDIISYVCKREARFVATSRPESMEEFLFELERMNFSEYDYLELSGIPSDNLESIVEKYCHLFLEAKGSSVQLEKPFVGKVVNCYRNLAVGPLSPMIICLVSYLIVNKGEDSQTWESRTSLFSAIFEAFYKKLKLRLLGKESYHFNERKFRSDLNKFRNNLHIFSLTTLRKNQIVFSYDEIAILEDGISQEFCEEAISAIFVSKKRLSIMGLEEFSSHSYPHKSFQEFLAAKRIFEEVTSLQQQPNSGDSILTSALSEDLDVEDVIFFVTGLLAGAQALTRSLCEELSDILGFENRDRCSGMGFTLIQETNKDDQIVKLISNLIGFIFLRDDNLKIANIVLRKDCPRLERVQMELETNSSTLLEVMSYLRDKPAQILINSKDKTVSKIILEEIKDGRCVIDRFQGRLDIDAMKLLPKSVRSLHLNLVGKEEIEAFRWLNETMGAISSTYENTEASERNYLIESIKLNVFDTCDLSLLPRRFSLTVGSLTIGLQYVSGQVDRILEVADWLCSVEFSLDVAVDIFLRAEKKSLNFDHADKILSYIKEKETNKLIEFHDPSFEGISLNGYFSENDVEEFPGEVIFCHFLIEGEPQARGLRSLVQRLQGGTPSHSNPIKVLHLYLRIYGTCNVDLLPDQLPSGSFHLRIALASIEEDDKKFDWLHRVLQKLPPHQWCNVELFEVTLDLARWRVLLDTLKQLQVKAKIMSVFESLSDAEFASLRDFYEVFNLHLMK